jgi:hypothetical protein
VRALVAALALAALAHAGCSEECATAACAPYQLTLRVFDANGQPMATFHGEATSHAGVTYAWSCGEGEPVDERVHCLDHTVSFRGEGFAEDIATVNVRSTNDFAAGVADVDAYVAENRPEPLECDPTTQCWTPDMSITLLPSAPP